MASIARLNPVNRCSGLNMESRVWQTLTKIAKKELDYSVTFGAKGGCSHNFQTKGLINIPSVEKRTFLPKVFVAILHG